jgi:Spy/CpxP family protein refolding chaperone
MKLRLLTITLLLLVAVAALAYAQNAPGPARGQGHPVMARIVKQLGLSQDQVNQIQAIVTKFHQDAQAIFKSGATDADKQAQIKALRDTAGAAITAVLTPDQQAKAAKMHLVELLLAPPRVARAVGGLMFALSKVGLSDQQKSTIKGLMDATKAAAKAIQDDTSLDQATKRAKMTQLWKDNNGKVMAVLTPEQQQKLKEILAKERQGRGRPGA